MQTSAIPPLGTLPWRRLALDWLGPVAVVVIGLVHLSLRSGTADFPGSALVHGAFMVSAAVLLGVRRRAPIGAPLLAIVVVTIWAAGAWPDGTQGPFEGFLLIVGASYCIASGNSGRRLVIGSAWLAAYFAASQIVLLFLGGGVGDLLPLTVWVVVAWGIGLLLNRRAQQAHEARQHASEIVADSDRRTEEAVLTERSRIARELHDVVAHSLSVIVVQSAAERRALAQGRSEPDSTDAVLDSIERTGREAMVDLRRLLGLLRSVKEAPDLSPQPSLRELDTLVEPIRQTNLQVDVVIEGDAGALPTGVDLSAYRIVQEALTNVVKHAGGTRAVVRLEYAPDELRIEVTDDGRGGGVLTAVGGGHGLVGMRERTLVFGGSLRAGPRPEGGWAVCAALPLAVVPEPR